MAPWLFLPLLALAAGALIPVQASANALLSKHLNSVVYAAIILFAIGLCVALSIALLYRLPTPSWQQVQQAPGYSFIGGLIVATYVLSITYLAPRLGVANAICLIVTGQIIAAVMIDHWGLMGSALHRLDLTRAVGVVLMVSGLFLAKR